MSKKPQEAGGYIRADEFFSSPKRTTIADDVRREIVVEREKTILDAGAVRQQEDWSHLASQMVGAEAG